MAQPTGPSPEQMRQMQQQFLAEATKKGMTPAQFQEHQRQQLAADAAKQGLTVEQYVNLLKQRAMQEHQMRQQQAQGQGQGKGQGQNQGQAHQHQHSQTQKIPVNPDVVPKPEALAVAKFLKSQDLKTRTCILDGQRKEMFKGNVSIIGHFGMCSHAVDQSNVHSEHYSLQPTKKPSAGTSCCLK